jgi:hypothetical protein
LACSSRAASAALLKKRRMFDGMVFGAELDDRRYSVPPAIFKVIFFRGRIVRVLFNHIVRAQ